ncbi:MAG: prepilin-type N-terminal cleavage/methylation domain-containing protein [bacterium]|nr:prepilin-type N-terminal cleavage/methylation domain-containing protein [bacterium]
MRRMKGFTLIELLIVVAIIGILAAIAVPNFLNAQIRAKVARTWSDMRSLVDAMEQYHLDRNSYPPDFDGIGLSNAGSEVNTYKQLTTPIAYMSTIPLDIWIRSDEATNVLGKNERYYEYYGSMTGVTTNPAMKKYSLGYVMRSVGPDQDADWKGDYDAIGRKTGTYTYSTSNGIQSSGDIMSSNRGLE